MRLTAAALCDAATVRENLLFVLGGGVTKIGRAAYPAPLGVSLAIQFYITAEELSGPHEVGAHLMQGETEVGHLKIQLSDPEHDVEPGEEGSVALAAPTESLVLPAPGRYSVVVTLDGEEATRLPFRAVAETGK